MGAIRPSNGSMTMAAWFAAPDCMLLRSASTTICVVLAGKCVWRYCEPRRSGLQPTIEVSPSLLLDSERVGRLRPGVDVPKVDAMVGNCLERRVQALDGLVQSWRPGAPARSQHRRFRRTEPTGQPAEAPVLGNPVKDIVRLLHEARPMPVGQMWNLSHICNRHEIPVILALCPVRRVRAVVGG